jgi:hypothetical protein
LFSKRTIRRGSGGSRNVQHGLAAEVSFAVCRLGLPDDTQKVPIFRNQSAAVSLSELIWQVA